LNTPASSFGATQSEPGCQGVGANDIWFQFDATSPSVRLDISGNGGNCCFGFEFSLEIYEGDCNTLNTVVPCKMYPYGHSGIPQTLYNLTPGTTYFIRLAASPYNSLEFNLCLRAIPEPPANDECAQAIPIQANNGVDCDLIYQGSTIGATQSMPACNGYYNAHDVWYQFTATAATHLIELKGNGAALGSIGVLGISLYDVSDCDNLSVLTCTDDGLGALINWSSLSIGETYYIRVFSWFEDGYDFTLCIRTPPPPPANSDCFFAETITPNPDLECGTPVSGSTAGLLDWSYFNCLAGTSLWYQFTASSNAYLIELQNIVRLFGDDYLAMELYEGTCDGLQPIQFSGWNSWHIVEVGLSPGTTYYVRVWSTLQTAVNFDLCILTIPLPTNEDCVDAVTLTAWPANCEISVTGLVTKTLTTEITSECEFLSDVWYKFVATNSMHIVSIDNIKTNYAPNLSHFELFSGDCDQLNSLGCFQTYAPVTYEFFTPGSTYYVRVGSNFSPSTLFDICISTPKPDLAIYSFYAVSGACDPGNNASVDVWIINHGPATVFPGEASVSLKVTGANSGTYGSYQNSYTLYPGYGEILSFTGIDLSNPGESQLMASGTVIYDANLSNNTAAYLFNGLASAMYFSDADSDGYGNPAESIESCEPNVFAQDFVNWSWDATCPFNSTMNLTDPPQAFGNLLSPAPEHLRIFPNPAYVEAQVVFDLETDAKVTIQMQDATGRIVKSVLVDGIPGANRHQLSLAGLPEGVYVVEVLAEGFRSIGKLAVLRP